ncbi:MAG: flagellin lysine-N-methylase [Clostridia bacterium]|nr:flagellin lysine-N-methylase [Clostridia bacterium]
MSEYVFNYYKSFKCIANKCKHSCCEKWQITIDKKSIKKYKKVKGDFKSALNSAIDFKTRSFNLLNGKCPFLNKDNLCELIISLGEDSLCSTCAIHPRFKNFFRGRVETGLGISCEEACRIILTQKEKQVLIKTDNKKDKLSKFDSEVLLYREEILNCIDLNKSVNENLNQILNKVNFNGKINYKKIADFLTKLERLDNNWEEKIKLLENEPTKKNEEYNLPFNQLLSYFVYRHISCAIDRVDLKTKTIFSVISTLIIKRICDNLNNNEGLKSVLETARAFSAEIEYSDVNLIEFYKFIERLVNLGE